jgi:hypothetical protein
VKDRGAIPPQLVRPASQAKRGRSPNVTLDPPRIGGTGRCAIRGQIFSSPILPLAVFCLIAMMRQAFDESGAHGFVQTQQE